MILYINMTKSNWQTCYEEHSTVRRERAVLSALTFTINHHFHHTGSKCHVSGVQGQMGGGAITCLKILACEGKTTG